MNASGLADSINSRHVYRILPYLACFLACSIVDLFYFGPATVFPDEQRFLASAARLVATGEFWVGSYRAWEMPGTALFFAPAVWLFGAKSAIIAIRFVQSILLVVQCGLIASIARRIFGNSTVAFIASCIAALYPFFLFYQGLLLSETLFNTLLLAGIAALYSWRERGMKIDIALLAACLCFAAATLTKPTLTILPPFLLAAIAWIEGLRWRRVFGILVAAACCYAAFISPWWIRNAVIFHAFVPFGTNAGENLYLGNNPHNFESGIDWASDVEPEVVKRLSAIPDELTRQRAFSKQATDYIKADPVAFLRAAGKKFMRFWNVVPNVAEFRTGLYSIVSAASFGPVLALALIGVWRCRRHWRALAPIFLITGYFTFIHVVTISSLRYRLPIEGLLIVLAAEPLAAFIAAVRPNAARRTAAAEKAPQS